MRHEQDPEPGLRKLAHGVSKPELRTDVQRIAGLIKKQRLRLMYQRPRNQRPLGFAGRHLCNRTIGQMRNAKPRERFVGASKMPGIGLLMRKDARAAEEAR